MKKVLFLRKKIEGQNSMEELACSLKSAMPEIEIVTLPYSSTSFIGMIKNILYARKHKADVNHIFSITEAYLAPFIKGKKIVTVHDLYFRHFSIWGRIASKLLWIYLPSLFVNSYICISNHTKNQLLNLLFWCKKKIKVIYNPLSSSFFEPYEKQKNTLPIILQIGTAKHKNLDITIKAIKNLDYQLIIVGILFPEQQQLLDELNIQYENYYDISRKELIELYKRADIVSFPSRQEGFGMIVIEANAMRTPIVTGDIPVLREIGQDATIYVKPDDVTRLQEAFVSILKDSDIRQSLVSKGWVNANRFNLELIKKQYEEEYCF